MHALAPRDAPYPARARLRRLVWLMGLGFALAAHAQEAEIRFDSLSDLGGVGLLQVPTARFAPEGDFSVSSSRVSPYFRNALTMQPLPWVEGVVRYTTVQNRLYGPADFSGGQLYKDRGIDLKFLLLQESATFPQVAVGFRDVAGTGLFSSEYVVLSRRYYDLDFSIGLAWGNLGTRGQVTNPFGHILSSFKSRQNNVGRGGNLSFQYFHGESASLIGGVQYRTPIPGLVVKAELDGNNYQSDALGNKFSVKSPINLGLVYSPYPWLDLSLGFERGQELMLQLALRSNLHTAKGMPKIDPPPPRVVARDLRPDIAAAAKAREPHERPQEALALKMTSALESADFLVDSVKIGKQRATATLTQENYRAIPRAIGRAARAMANSAPADVEELSIVTLEDGIAAHQVTLMRSDLEKADRYMGSAEEIAAHARIEAPNLDDEKDAVRNPKRYPSFSWGWSPAMKHHIGGPDNPYFYQIFLRTDGELRLTRGLSISGGLGFNLYNNFDSLKLPSDSKLPHVRSDIKDYLKEGKNNISRLQVDYLSNLGQDWYGRLSGGLFEEMFGGIGGEILYKPFGTRWAVGADYYRVRQRDFDQRFSFRDYRTDTGHLDLYYQLPYYNALANLSYGRYLARDRGFTFSLSRAFDSGASFGFFFTKTNVSAEQFGEGSFDKGFFVSIPIDMLSLYSSRNAISMGWRPLTRDGGQRLGVGKRLYPAVGGASPEGLMRDWGELLN